jgi:hypothetical protein
MKEQVEVGIGQGKANLRGFRGRFSIRPYKTDPRKVLDPLRYVLVGKIFHATRF